jgi:hypothetical protein
MPVSSLYLWGNINEVDNHIAGRQVFEVVAATLGVKDLDGLSRTFYQNTCRFVTVTFYQACRPLQMESLFHFNLA